ncbi:MAG: KilA-N domain-containing protein [Waterburya sp.]
MRSIGNFEVMIKMSDDIQKRIDIEITSLNALRQSLWGHPHLKLWRFLEAGREWSNETRELIELADFVRENVAQVNRAFTAGIGAKDSPITIVQKLLKRIGLQLPLLRHIRTKEKKRLRIYGAVDVKTTKTVFCDRIDEQYFSRSRVIVCTNRTPSAVQPNTQVAQMNNISLLSYNGQQISQRGSDGFVNATEMAKANDVRIDKYLENESTKQYLKALQQSISPENGENVELIVVCGFGSQKATWMHPLAAIHFAQWISPEFHVWCNQHIKTLIEMGTTSIEPVNPLDALIAGLQELKAVQERQNWLEAKTKELEGFVHQHDGEIARIFSPYGNYYSVMGYANLKGKKISFAEAVRIGKLCAKSSRELGIAIDELQDPRFGRVNSYAEVVLQKYFN